jgi:uncharacterized protein (TIGR02145 family)
VFVVAVAVGVVAMQVIRQYWSTTEATSSNITVTDNNQTVSVDWQSGATTITRTSTVTVKDSAASNGYVLTAKIAANTLLGTTVTIGSGSSSQCGLASPCDLSGTARTVLTTDSTNTATTTAGETTIFTVTMTIPSDSVVGNYILDIEYGEDTELLITGTSPSGEQAKGTTEVTLSATTNFSATCIYGTLDSAYDMTGSDTVHKATVSVAPVGNYSYMVLCRSSDGVYVTSIGSINFSVPSNYETMQTMTVAECDRMNASSTIELTDSRDNKIYRVRKMADGRCWMIDNLAFDLANANAPAYDPAEQLVSGSTPSVNTQAQYILNSSYTTNAGQATYLYNWCAAMGDTSTNCATTVAYEANQPSGGVIGICPAPFRLPIGGASASTSGDASTTNNEFAKLDIAMGGTGQNRENANTHSNWMGTSTSSSTAWGGVLSGVYYSVLSTGTDGYWWSSTAYSSTYTYGLRLRPLSSLVYPAADSNDRYIGFAVRCVL